MSHERIAKATQIVSLVILLASYAYWEVETEGPVYTMVSPVASWGRRKWEAAKRRRVEYAMLAATRPGEVIEGAEHIVRMANG